MSRSCSFIAEIIHARVPHRRSNILNKISEQMSVTILSRPNCHLCNVVMRIAKNLQQEYPMVVEKVLIDSDPNLVTAFGHRIPVVLVDGIEQCAGKITEGDLRRAIRRARWRRPISRILSRLGYAPRRG